MRRKIESMVTAGATSCRRNCGGARPRLARIKEAKKVLEQRARDKALAEGKNAEEAKLAKPQDKDQYNFTDPESRSQVPGARMGLSRAITRKPLWSRRCC